MMTNYSQFFLILLPKKQVRDFYTLARLCMSLSILFLSVSPLFSAEFSARPDIKEMFDFQLPGHWELERFNIKDSVDYGTKEEPIIKCFFTATIILREDLYRLTQKTNTESFLVLTVKAGERRILSGFTTSVKKDEEWHTKFSLNKKFLII